MVSPVCSYKQKPDGSNQTNADLRRQTCPFLISVVLLLLLLLPSTIYAIQEVSVSSFPAKPLIFQDSDGITKGISADLINQIALDSNWNITYVPGSWEDSLNLARAKKIDLITSVMHTRERDHFLDYNKEPYLTVWSAVYTLPETSLKTVLDLNGKMVAIMKGDQNALNFKVLADKFNLDCHYLEFSNFKEVFSAVQQGKAIAGVAVNIFRILSAETYQLVQTPIIFSPKALYFAAPEGANKELLSTIDDRLRSWKKDKDSFYYKSLSRWLNSGSKSSPFIPIWLLYSLAILGCTLFAIYIWNVLLKKKVNLKTTELEEQTNLLIENEAKLRILFDQSPIAIFIVDRKSGKYINANKAAEALTGRSLAELTKLSTRDVTPDKYQQRIQKINQQAPTYDFGEVKYLRPNGEIRTALLNAIPINDSLSYGLAHDITERKLAEEKYKTLIEEANAGIALADATSGEILECNQTLADMVERSRDEIIGQSQAILHPEGQQLPEGITKSFKRSATSQTNTNMTFQKCITSSGKEFDVEIKAKKIEYAGKQMLLGIFYDVSELLHLQNQLRQKYKMEAIGVMAGGIAHNFNNSLAIILGSLELAKRKISNTEKLVDYIDTAIKAAYSSRDLVSQVLTYSRQDNFQHVATDITLVVEETLKLFKTTLPTTASLLFDNHLTAKSMIKADPNQIQEALLNLCNNAVHAMNEKGKLTVQLTQCTLCQEDIPAQYKCHPGPYVCLTIEDDGCGMDDTTMEKIFDPFFTTKTVGEGTGMGLATVQGIIEKHDGMIHVSSAIHKGTTFKLFFPISGETSNTLQQSRSELVPRGTESVLIIDDDETLLTLKEEILTDLGYDVTVSAQSSAALDEFSQNRSKYSLVITDQTMPGLTGQEVISEMKKIEPDIRTILLTGYSSKINEEKSRSLGIDAFCMKPLNLDELARTVRRVLDTEPT